MLNYMRENARSVLTYVFFGIIILVFSTQFGPGSMSCGDTNLRSAGYAAKVNSTTINVAEYERTFSQYFRFYQAQGGGQMTRELADQLGLGKMALDQLINQELLIQQASKSGLAVGDDEVSKLIKEDASFHSDGKFDIKLYKKSFPSPGKYEDEVRRRLIAGKMSTAVRSAARVSEDEIKTAWTAENDKVNIQFVRFATTDVQQQAKATPAEVDAFAKDNSARVEQFYKDNTFRYDKKKKVRARHILIKADDKAPEADQQAAKKKIEGFAERIKKGEDFAKMATENSDDPGSKVKGGDLDFFGQGVMAKEFDEAAFALKIGEVSSPVKTRFGWHLIKAEEIQEPEVVALDKVRADIARELIESDRAKALAKKRAEETLAKVKSGKSLATLFPPAPEEKADAPKKPGSLAPPMPPTPGAKHVDETGLFSLSGEYIPKLGPVAGLAKDAFAGDAGKPLPQVYETPAGFMVGQVKERQKPDPAKFEEVKKDFSTRLRNRKESEIEQAWLKAIREKSQVEVNEGLVKGGAGSGAMDLEG